MSEPPSEPGQGQPGETPPDASSDPGSPDYAGSPDDGPRRGAHRAGSRPTPPPPPPAGAPYWPAPPEAPPGEKLKQPLADVLPVRLLQIGGALLGVIVLVGLLYLLFGNNNDKGDQSAGSATGVRTTAPAVTTTAGTTTGATGTVAATSAGAATTTGKPAATTKPTTSKPATSKPATSKPAVKPTTSKTTGPATKPPTVAPPAVSVKAPLLVLNNSRIHGLAVTGAAAFRNGGWTVLGTGNYTGRLAQTTVFFSAGQQAAAETLARQFPTVTAVQPQPRASRATRP